MPTTTDPSFRSILARPEALVDATENDRWKRRSMVR
jgi:hypothetical protein